MLPLPPSSPAPAAAATPGAGAQPAAQVLLLLRSRPALSALQRLLCAAPVRIQVTAAGSLREAMIAVAAQAPALVVVDATLCDALEREFVDHVLRVGAATQVVLLCERCELPDWPHPRLVHVTPADLPVAVGLWIAACAGAAGVPR